MGNTNTKLSTVVDECQELDFTFQSGSDGRETLKHRIKYAEKVKKKGRKLQEGCRALQTGDLDTAEQHFAAALRAVHVKGQHSKEVEPLCKLSDVYLKRGEQSKDGGDFTKAAALSNAALVRLKAGDRESIKQTIQDITRSFVKNILSIEQTVPTDDVEKHKTMLTECRYYVEKEIKRIEQQIDPYSLDDNDPEIRKVEKKRVEANKALFDTIVQQRRTFIAGLVDECIMVMGPPPCKYAMIGLGSQATGLVTPYSDLESAILIQRETENSLKYFHNLTHYLHLKVINLGETILPAMAIKSLNDFESENKLDNWFYDSRTTIWETIQNMHKKGAISDQNAHHLMVLVSISAELRLRTYMNNRGQVENINGQPVEEPSTLFDNSFILQADVYESLCDYNNSKACIEQALRTEISTHGTGAIHPRIARLLNKLGNAWSHLGDNRKAVSCHQQSLQMTRSIYGEGIAHPDIATSLNNLGKTWSHLGDNRKAVSCHEQAIEMNRSIYGKGIAHPDIASSLNNLGLAWSDLGDYRKAVSYHEQALEMWQSIYGKGIAHPNIASSLNNLGIAWSHLGDYRKAVSCYEQALEMRRSIYGEGIAHPDIAGSLNNLGLAWSDLGDYRKAVSYHEQALEMRRSIYGEGIAHPGIATSLDNLGLAWSDLGDYRKAVSFHEQALEMRRSIYGEGIAHPGIAGSLNNLGLAWSDLGDYRKAVSYHEQSLEMELSIYGEGIAHPGIASSINNLGSSWGNLGYYRKAISYFEQSLEMRQTIYGEGIAHPDILTSLRNLHVAWSDLGDHSKAASYYTQLTRMEQMIEETYRH
ncbi:hypothetical protein Bbelb_191030 [Branchiostoma belcheri]|nr:hypothetical protein Bbelb_191030 [Branchiostoma belcheri]